MVRKVFVCIFISAFCVIFSACQTAGIPLKDKDLTEKNEIVETHGGLQNVERLDDFIYNVKNDKKDKVRLTRYTIEGDPIYHDLDYTDSKLTFTLDTREDEYGHGAVTKSICKGIQKQELETETNYLLTGCENEPMKGLLTIFHDVDKEDNFAFELNYGVGKKNMINTKEEKLIKDLQNGETVAVGDFQFSKKELNQIYKLLKFSNYLGDKNLTTKCNQKPHERYELNVWINSGERHFEWTECDHSSDGKEMTKLVHDILTILKKNSTYKTLGDYE
ncbi:DUF4362 domain-containing protein [Neobacillus kokaensis]|uniref:DUF4362 domain-containing protein n=1 Tax=Neobacillus kokaensis TaxID=2759023 RepID=A0ABQ3N088_9BACI|nr:DUF4362 domain-containing protein [Neobacillus kokaensis]GHH96918.1 hypothetical protein AM1BK_04610 [Neobacillus kokaensis]